MAYGDDPVFDKFAEAAWRQSIWSNIDYKTPSDEAFAKSVFESGLKWRTHPIDPNYDPHEPWLDRQARLKVQAKGKAQ